MQSNETGASGARLVAGTVQWPSLGGRVSAPVTANDADGRLQVFGVGHDGTVWHIGQPAPHLWTGWRCLGGPVTSGLAVGVHRDGRMDVFARGTNNALWHAWQTEAGSSEWSGWKSLGGALHGAPAVGQDSEARLHVFARGADGALWPHRRDGGHQPLGRVGVAGRQRVRPGGGQQPRRADGGVRARG